MSLFLFEVSWEVCNKVGGIYTVIRSKLAHAQSYAGDNYFLLGPDLGNNPDFEPAPDDPVFRNLIPSFEAKGLNVRMGYWNVEGRPRAILVSFKNRYEQDKLLFELWQDFGVDSFGGEWEYVEPVLFSTVCGEVIATVFESLSTPQDQAMAHFHEWMCGAGLLYLKKHNPEIATVFTTHATILGRSLSGSSINIYDPKLVIDGEVESKRHHVGAKFSMEKISAREADCFTTVSQITAAETQLILGKAPDVITWNGIDVAGLGETVLKKTNHLERRQQLLHLARTFLQKPLADQTGFWITAGRYEYHNKGYDVILKSLALLDRKLREQADSPSVVMLMMIAAGHKGVSNYSRKYFFNESVEVKSPVGLITHNLYDEQNDPILKACNELGLTNGPENKVHIIFSTAYLDGHDGVFNMPYYELLASCDLSVFPSCYEPWGYTPLESIALRVPTISSDLAGFGKWVQQQFEFTGDAISVLHRAQINDDAVVHACVTVMQRAAALNFDALIGLREQAQRIAIQADWHAFYPYYIQAYELAVNKAVVRVTGALGHADAYSFVSFSDTGFREPRYRTFSVVPQLPKELEGLKEIASNVWYSWHRDAIALFEEMDPLLFEQVEYNPIRMLMTVPNKTLKKLKSQEKYMKQYEAVLKRFKIYMARKRAGSEGISDKQPIAYFSMEYGLTDHLPIFSGGLGILSGDHLKSASDLNIPLIGIGLMYKQGYFTQHFNQKGQQEHIYEMHDFSQMPMSPLLDKSGNEIKIAMDMPGRTLYARIWKVQVGTVTLYLLDSDIEENNPQDREITWKLYGGDRKYRMKQELLLGIGGVKLIADVLHLDPMVYHMNEGHSAFLIFERIHSLMQRGLTFQQASEAVRASNVFTTHTPVPAGNEAFDVDIIKYYLTGMAQKLGIDIQKLLDMGRVNPSDRIFSMTIFALQMSQKANGVSQLHGLVSREMWQHVWPGFAIEDVPIGAVTNGVHLSTWLGNDMKAVLNDGGIQWDTTVNDLDMWQTLKLIPDPLIWFHHQAQKSRLVDLIKKRVKEEYILRGESSELISMICSNWSADTLTIGFARRFAPYKRAHLLFQDIERLQALVKDEERPVQIVIAGKAHPADTMGQKIIESLMQIVRDKGFNGRVVILENYNIELAKVLVQGVDVWLNNPLFKKEASGTSGMKAGINGALNLSVCDGWWYEAFNPQIGFGIFSGAESMDQTHIDQIDHHILMDLLENEVVPYYYEKEAEGVSLKWVTMMKAAIASIAAGFSSMRMVNDYFNEMYSPVAARYQQLKQKQFDQITQLTDWKSYIRSRFMTMQVKELHITGLRGDTIMPSQPIVFEILVDRGKAEFDELSAALIVNPKDSDGIGRPECLAFEKLPVKDNAQLVRFKLTYTAEKQGNFNYGVRIMPVHPLLYYPLEAGVVYWV